jgi:outer membrane lipoprotein-sorting protein
MAIRIGAALLLAAAGAMAADDLPKADTILDKYVEATGGKAAYQKVHSEITSGSMELTAMGIKGKMVSYTAEPDKSYTEVTMEGIGQFRDGSNGQVAWSINAMQGPRLKEGDEKAEALLRAKFNSDHDWRKIYDKAETVGVEQVDGKDCYKIVLTPKTGNPVTRYYDKESNLLVKMVAVLKGPMGEISTESMPGDYRKEGEILMPHKIIQKAASQQFTITIDSVQHNAEIPKEKFDVPPEIQALMKK